MKQPTSLLAQVKYKHREKETRKAIPLGHKIDNVQLLIYDNDCFRTVSIAKPFAKCCHFFCSLLDKYKHSYSESNLKESRKRSNLYYYWLTKCAFECPQVKIKKTIGKCINVKYNKLFYLV